MPARAFLVRRGARGLPLQFDLHHAALASGHLQCSSCEHQRCLSVFPANLHQIRSAVNAIAASALANRFGLRSNTWPLGCGQAVASLRPAWSDARAVGVQMPKRSRPSSVYLENTRFGGATRPQILVTFT